MQQTHRDLAYLCHAVHRNTSRISVFDALTIGSGSVPYTGDILFLNGLGARAFFFKTPRSLPLSDYMGFPHNRLVNERAPIYLTPRPKILEWSGRDDVEKYGSILGNFLRYANNVDVGDTFITERQVLHSRYSGCVRSEIPDALYRRVLTSDPDFHPDLVLYPYRIKEGSAAPGRLRAQQNGTNEYRFDVAGHVLGDGTPVDFEIEEYVQTACSRINATGALGYSSAFTNGSGWLPSWHNAVNRSSWKGDLFHLDLSYLYHQRDQWDEYWDFQVTLKATIGFAPCEGSNDPYAWNTISEDSFICEDHTSVEFVSTNTAYSGVVLSPEPVVASWNAGLWSGLDQVSAMFSEDFAEFRSHTTARDGKVYDLPKHHVLQRNMEARLADIRPSSFLAASDALDKHISVLQANMLQTMQHLNDIVQVLPDVKSLAPLVRRCSQGDATVIPEIVDYVTSAILRYNFVQRPLIKDGRELLATDLRASLSSLLQAHEATIYGSFRYTFTDSENFFGPGLLELETRAKIRISSDLSTALVAYFAANGVGAAPNLARLWSLLPGSFIVDWFTNEAKRLHQVDNQFAWLAFRAQWCLWSYKVVYRPTVEELAEYNLVNLDPEDPLLISAYMREFSAYSPQLRESKFDFLRPTSSPNFATVGSLLWQLV